MALYFTAPKLEAELALLDWRLGRVIIPQAAIEAENLGWNLWLTSIVRDNSPIHKALRAGDGDLVESLGHTPSILYHKAGETIAAWTNRHFDYGAKGDGSPGQVCLWHNVVPEAERTGPRHGWHLHFQSPAGGIVLV